MSSGSAAWPRSDRIRRCGDQRLCVGHVVNGDWTSLCSFMQLDTTSACVSATVHSAEPQWGEDGPVHHISWFCVWGHCDGPVLLLWHRLNWCQLSNVSKSWTGWIDRSGFSGRLGSNIWRGATRISTRGSERLNEEEDKQRDDFKRCSNKILNSFLTLILFMTLLF